jgi:hypothetical protein
MTVYGRSGWILSAVAIGMLLMGVLVYLFFRSGSLVYFLAGIIPEAVDYTVSTGTIFNSIPSFFHIYAFILLTAIVLNPSRTGLILICFGWIAIELFFEIGQHPFFAQHLTEWVPAWFANFPYLEVANSYFLSGTFDPVDVLFILFGTAAAVLTVYKVQRREVYHV